MGLRQGGGASFSSDGANAQTRRRRQMPSEDRQEGTGGRGWGGAVWGTGAAEERGDKLLRPPKPPVATWVREVPLGDEPRPAVAGRTGRDGRRKSPDARAPLDVYQWGGLNVSRTVSNQS